MANVSMSDFEQKMREEEKKRRENWFDFWYFMRRAYEISNALADCTPFTIECNRTKKYYDDTRIIYQGDKVTMLTYDENNKLILIVLYSNKKCMLLLGDNVLREGLVIDAKQNEKTDEYEITCKADDISCKVVI